MPHYAERRQSLDQQMFERWAKLVFLSTRSQKWVNSESESHGLRGLGAAHQVEPVHGHILGDQGAHQLFSGVAQAVQLSCTRIDRYIRIK